MCGIAGGRNQGHFDCVGIGFPYFDNIEPTGETHKIIIKQSKTNKRIFKQGDVVIVYDENGILPESTCNNIKHGELEVGFGIWKNEDLEIFSIKSVNKCNTSHKSIQAGLSSNSNLRIKKWSKTKGLEYIDNIGGIKNIKTKKTMIFSDLKLTHKDCHGIENGKGIVDLCGVCDGRNYLMDECGVCGGDGSSCEQPLISQNCECSEWTPIPCGAPCEPWENRKVRHCTKLAGGIPCDIEITECSPSENYNQECFGFKFDRSRI